MVRDQQHQQHRRQRVKAAPEDVQPQLPHRNHRQQHRALAQEVADALGGDQPVTPIGEPGAEVGILVVAELEMLPPRDVLRNVDEGVADAERRKQRPQHQPPRGKDVKDFFEPALVGTGAVRIKKGFKRGVQLLPEHSFHRPHGCRL